MSAIQTSNFTFQDFGNKFNFEKKCTFRVYRGQMNRGGKWIVSAYLLNLLKLHCYFIEKLTCEI